MTRFTSCNALLHKNRDKVCQIRCKCSNFHVVVLECKSYEGTFVSDYDSFYVPKNFFKAKEKHFTDANVDKLRVSQQCFYVFCNVY